MTSDRRFQRTLLAVAEAVQTFSVGTFDFAESIKQIWGPQTEPDAVETSNPLPVEGTQDVQVVDKPRGRTPISQNGYQLPINSHSHPPSVTMEDAHLEPLHEEIGLLDTANSQLSKDMDALATSTRQSVKCCYSCYARWMHESANPRCQSIPGRTACEYCVRMQISCNMIPEGEMREMLQCKREAELQVAAQNDNASIGRDPVYEAFQLLGAHLVSSFGDIPRQKATSKRAYQDIDEQQSMSKRQRTHEVREEAVPHRNEHLKKATQQDHDDHGAARGRYYSSSLSDSSSSVSSTEEEVKVQIKRETISPVRISNQVPVARTMTHKEAVHLEEENERSSTLTQEQSSEESSLEEDNHEHSSEEDDEEPEEETLQALAERVSQWEEGFPKTAPILQQDESEPSSSSSEADSSEEVSEAEPEEQLKNQLGPEAGSQDEHKETVKAISILPEEENDESGSPSSSSEDSSSEEGSDDEPGEPEQPAG
ncbi:uncharacterized protein PGRI_032990 [Penicillium griseofulvum]|uniref:Uncharacterized protein n=1 Tax=Penicillium patulum TaxID=5078 RepID=A0A135L999_PENPA|nr:uncharacterized protein PGRI_032990 [Penicillium griseofulvum]KXG45532.1 hypothetical protein PGRI_032990 [Penicillium griseofulvum]